jgi:hypothetical protein
VDEEVEERRNKINKNYGCVREPLGGVDVRTHKYNVCQFHDVKLVR